MHMHSDIGIVQYLHQAGAATNIGNKWSDEGEGTYFKHVDVDIVQYLRPPHQGQ